MGGETLVVVGQVDRQLDDLLQVVLPRVLDSLLLVMKVVLVTVLEEPFQHLASDAEHEDEAGLGEHELRVL